MKNFKEKLYNRVNIYLKDTFKNQEESYQLSKKIAKIEKKDPTKKYQNRKHSQKKIQIESNICQIFSFTSIDKTLALPKNVHCHWGL